MKREESTQCLHYATAARRCFAGSPSLAYEWELDCRSSLMMHKMKDGARRRGKEIFEVDDDSKAFLYRLGQVCGSHGWRVHAWVLMGNHFHLLLETPEPNLVTGMKFLLGTFSQGWNARRSRRGHVFQGRYKSVPVSAAVESPYYFRIAADYIHLNPARAGLAGGKRGQLVSYKWSSLADYARGNGPDWLVMDRLLNAFELAKDGRGRRAYVAWIEARAATTAGKSMRRR